MLRQNSGYDGTLSSFIRLINSFSIKFKKSLEDKQYSIRKEQYAELLKKLIYEKQMAKVKEISSLLLKKRQLLTHLQEKFTQKILLLHEYLKIIRNQSQIFQLDHPRRIEQRSAFRNFMSRYCINLNKSEFVQFELIQDEELIDFQASNQQEINYIIYKNKLVDKRKDFLVKLVKQSNQTDRMQRQL
ncbi:UNKNOWN [Stylonychia lemnae]|uniref:Uncharacterized protein n=1 Tax=Stylonychia lemnae TaxID=5949 RepID=A0A077ZP68_STYLE|nr:UNKNOWN [Stylonychia lemnae]|eukprot:CDW71254.1 UNKNOWN [Stylonychia lemnae]